MATHGVVPRGGRARLGYSLSTLSEQVAALERLVAQRLVERPGGRRADRDHAGRAASARARRRESRHGSPRPAPISRRSAARAGACASGSSRAWPCALLPAIVRELAERRPDLALELVERADDGLLLDLVAAGDLDAAFAVGPLGDRALAVEALLDDPYIVLVSAASPLAGRATLAVADLVHEPLIDYRELRLVHHGRGRLPAGARPRVVARSDDGPTIHALVGAGVGIALVPRLTVDLRDDTVRAIALEPPVTPRRVALAWQGDREPDGLAELRAAARRAAATLGAAGGAPP